MRKLALAAAVLLSLSGAQAQYAGWQHSGSLWVLTDAQGAALPAGAVEEGFPLLLRLHGDWFDFRQAQPHGEDLRVATAAGAPLPYQVEEWDPARGTASVWVRLPQLKGDSRQELRLFWGKADAASDSNGAAVFGDANGYVSVWHMTDPVVDELHAVTSVDHGTTGIAGMIGPARHFQPGAGIACGEKLTCYPSGDAPSTTEAWVRVERPNVDLVCWGNEGGGRGTKVRMRLQSPPHIRIDSAFADVRSEGLLKLSEWLHVVHTYEKNNARLYINGRLDGASTPSRDFKSPMRCWLGGWYNNYSLTGEMDEVRIAKVARDAHWVRAEYENTKPCQTLVGSLVQPGGRFAVTPAALTVNEGQTATVTAEAGGAQKVCWLVGGEVVAVDRLSFTYAPGRIAADRTTTLTCRAVYPDGVQTLDIPVSVKKVVPEPVFTLSAPARWDGRETIEVAVKVTNAAALAAAKAEQLHYAWTVDKLATVREEAPGKLILRAAQASGKLTVALALDNGGTPTIHTVDIDVQEPRAMRWAFRPRQAEELPEEGEFYPRDGQNQGILVCAGTLAEPAEQVVLKVWAEDAPFATQTTKPEADRSYRVIARLKPGLVHYRMQLAAVAGGQEKVLHTAGNLVCGDCYLINGQSNAVSTDWGKFDAPEPSEWVRSFGYSTTDPRQSRLRGWGQAVARAPSGKCQVGYWGLVMGKRLVETSKLPICLVNGAVGGTRIDQHQRNAADPTDATTIYGRLLWRVQQARLTHGVRGILWHQGENDQGADGPTGGYGWETYRQYFIDLAAGWKTDYPNVEHYYLFQIWPRACAMGSNGSDNQLREVQRTLPDWFSNLHVMSTLGVQPPGGCHYPAAGYAALAQLISPLVERDCYGKFPTGSITPPNLKRAAFTTAARDELALEFDQPVVWQEPLVSQFYLDGQRNLVAAGAVAGNVLTLKLKAPSTAKALTYLDSAGWNEQNLLRGANGIAALTFWGVPLGP